MNNTDSRAVGAQLECNVRPAAWIQHHKAGDNLEWEDPGGKRTALYDEQTLWNACARAAQLEAAEEGAKVAFGHVVEQKRAAEKECMRLQGLLAAAYADIRRLSGPNAGNNPAAAGSPAP